MTTRNMMQEFSLDGPLYAVPDGALRCDLPTRGNWTRFEKLQFKSGEDLEKYKFDGRAAFV